ncbi:MAG: hypothetical protein GAK43_00134 [Stenotrophomonas maltophilia]|nr:MAG: hypothetical protein GAK43_00134 [Stenotrophomonas maltophilia]
MQGTTRVPDDFEARIRVLTRAEGGRRSPPRNGIRWDFAYADEKGELALFMIWPLFLGQDGQPLPEGDELPVGPWLQARMTIVSDALRVSEHRARITEGVCFHCHEGPHVVAAGEVTRVTGLHSDRSAPVPS